MKNISDKNVIIIVLITVLFVFGLIFSVKSPERQIIDSPILWKENYINSSYTYEQNQDNQNKSIFLMY